MASGGISTSTHHRQRQEIIIHQIYILLWDINFNKWLIKTTDHQYAKAAPDEMDTVRCFKCKSESRETAYTKFHLCEHFVCWDCFIYLDNFKEIVIVSMCMDCSIQYANVVEVDYDIECPTCFIDYAASNTTRAEHNCLGDEGIYDMWTFTCELLDIQWVNIFLWTVLMNYMCT